MMMRMMRMLRRTVQSVGKETAPKSWCLVIVVIAGFMGTALGSPNMTSLTVVGSVTAAYVDNNWPPSDQISKFRQLELRHLMELS